MLTADAWRSLLFVVLGFILFWIYLKKSFKEMYLGIALTVLVVADMWPVDKRFCNDDVFVSKKTVEKDLKMLPYEQALLQSDNSIYRVLNLTANTFNDSRTSYYFNSIGGYSAAKLRRYQDLIDEHISQMNPNVLNMLNAKYIITRGNDGSPTPHLNPGVYGNCWFVDSLCLVNNANDESEMLRSLDLSHIAVLDTTFKANKDICHSFINNALIGSGDSINLTYFGQNRLEYASNSSSDRMAVFSEIYYPYGWNATIDGQETDIQRVNYTLRAINVPAGEHKIVFKFDPPSVKKGNMMSMLFLLIMLCTTVAILTQKYRKRGSLVQKTV